MSVFRSLPKDCTVEPHGWFPLSSTLEITKLPIFDAAHPGMAARLGRGPAAKWLAGQGLRLPTAAEYSALHGVAYHIEPYTLPTLEMWGAEAGRLGVSVNDAAANQAFRQANMMGFEWCEQHDIECWRRLEGWDGVKPVDNFGKHWSSEGIIGWWTKHARKYGVKNDFMIQTLSTFHNSDPSYVDYASNFHAVRETKGVVVSLPPVIEPAKEPVNDSIKFVQARNFTRGRRNPKTGKACGVDLVVIHDMESAESTKTAENVAAWFAGAGAPQASAHYNCDSDSVIQSVRDEDTAWHAPGANHNGIGVELAGRASQTPEQWADEFSAAMLDRAADLIASLCSKHSVPAVYVDAAGLLRGERGITTHADVSRAWKRSTHTDPGKGFPLASFIADVASRIAIPDDVA